MIPGELRVATGEIEHGPPSRVAILRIAQLAAIGQAKVLVLFVHKGF